MKIIDDNTKKLHWWNRNYFFAATIVIALVNIILFGALGDRWQWEFDPDSTFYSTLDFSNMIRAFMNSFSHENWQHVLLNMLCFFLCGLYLERKMGTLPFFALTLVLVFFSMLAIATLSGIFWHGFSGVNFALYAYIVVDYPFVFRKRNRTRFNIIAGAVMLALIYFASCFNGGAYTFGFEWYPYDFMTNAGHYGGFAAGLVVGLVVQLTRLIAEKSSQQ